MAFLTITVFYFAGMFAFAFGTAFLVPLVLAVSEPADTSWIYDPWRFVPDLILLANGLLPVFLIIKLVRNIRRHWPRALAKWREDAALRRHFRIFAGCSALAAAAAWV